MKFQSLAALCVLATVASAHNTHHGRHAAIAKRQAATTSLASAAAPAASSSLAVAGAVASSGSASQASSASVPATSGTAAAPVAPVPPGASSAAAAASSAPLPSNLPTGDGDVPPLTAITSGMPSGTPLPVTTTYTVGASPSYYSGAPPLPTAFVFNAGDWPTQDIVAPTNSAEVQEWMKELDGVTIPNFAPTADGSCAGDPTAASQAAQRGWWTCGGYTRATDITECPDKMTWGLSFDDGPSPYTQKLLGYLNQKNLHATFYVVGSRVIERPQVLIEEYMAGHEISVHTWSHHPLTSLTNEQIVAELGWTRKAIKAVLGVTPTTMRPPFGDIDDRVRAIALAMGLTPQIWTRAPSGFPFDTNDWRVAGGLVTGVQQYETFQSILSNATTMNNGFIVLEHDLFEITVDLAVGYTLDAALTHQPPFTLKAIGECLHMPTQDLYLETTTNTTFLAALKSHNGTSTASSASVTGGAKTGGAAPSYTPLPTAVVVAGLAALLGGALF